MYRSFNYYKYMYMKMDVYVDGCIYMYIDIDKVRLL